VTSTYLPGSFRLYTYPGLSGTGFAVGKVICVELICVDGEGLGVVSGARLSRGLGDEEVLATLSAAARRRAVAGAGCTTD
jgi:hypothetical protein